MMAAGGLGHEDTHLIKEGWRKIRLFFLVSSVYFNNIGNITIK